MHNLHTQIVLARDWESNPTGIALAADTLRTGGLVVFPTETVYGLGANALDAEAVAGIFRAKGRPADNPLIVHITAPEEVQPLVAHIPDIAHLLMTRFWPGPLTLIMPRSNIVPDIVTGGLDTVAVRMPAHPVARAILRRAGVPVAAPSANLSGTPSPTAAAHCRSDMTGRVDVIVDGGDCPLGVESTVLSLTGDRPRLLRPGAVTAAQLEEVLGSGSIDIDPAVTAPLAVDAAASSPGMKYRHYAPKMPLTIVHGSRLDFLRFAAQQTDACFLVFHGEEAQITAHAIAYGNENDAQSQARGLFAALRRLDDTAITATQAYARAPAIEGVGMAVYNRLLRAASFRELYL